MKIQAFFFFGFAAVLAVALGSCGKAELLSSVNQDRVYTYYELTYDANRDITLAKAAFRFGNATGTQLELDGGSSVSFNGQTLTKEVEPITLLTWYQRELAGFVSAGAFTWTDTDGNSYTNSITIPTIAIPAALDTILRSGSYEFFWDGTPLVTNEKAVVVINGANEGDLRLWERNDLAATSVILTQNDLNQFPAGTATMLLSRYYEPPIVQAPEAGGKIFGHYLTAPKQIVLQ